MRYLNSARMTNKAVVLACLLAVTAFLSGSWQAAAQAPIASEGKQSAVAPHAQIVLTGHTPVQVLDGRAVRVGHYDPEKKLRLVLAVQRPHIAEEEEFLEELQDKQSPLFHQFLSAEEWNARFAPSAEDEQKIVDWAESQGLTVTNRFANRLLVDLEAPVGVIEKAFNVTINNYQVDDELDFSNDRDPAIPAQLSGIVSTVLGLNRIQRVSRVGSRSRKKIGPDYAPGPVYSVVGSSQGDGDPTKAPWNQSAEMASEPSNLPLLGLATPANIFSSEAYDFAALDALGHCCNPHHDAGGSPPDSSIGLVTFGGFSNGDPDHFFSQYGMAWNYTVLEVDGNVYQWMECKVDVDPDCPGDAEDDEAPADVEFSTASANSFGASNDTAHVFVYEVVNDTIYNYTDLLNFMLSDNHARVLSTSYGWPESGTPFSSDDIGTLHGIFNSMEMQGWTLISAAGDNGSVDGCTGGLVVHYPASDPDFVAAGGTELSLDINGDFASEVAWTGGQKTGSCSKNDGGGGGGVSVLFDIPYWQDGIAVGQTKRVLPDISLNAGGILQLFYCTDPVCRALGVDGGAGVGGTSIVAPELAGFFAQENAYLASIGNKCGSHGTSRCDHIGNANPILYYEAMNRIAAHYPFYDITKGCNSNDITTKDRVPFYCAVPGYDLATGWGSANMLQLAWAFNSYLTEAHGNPYITFSGPDKNKWYNTNQTVKWTIHDFAGTGLPQSAATGIAGLTQGWDSLPDDPKAEPHGGSGNSFYSGPQFPNAYLGCLSFVGVAGGCSGGSGQGCHTAHARGWNNQGWSTAGNPSYPETYGPLCYDSVAPTIDVIREPATPASHWFKGSVTLTVKAADPGGKDASGLADVYWAHGTADCSPQKLTGCSHYTTPIILNTQGSHAVTAFSKDNAGNFSEVSNQTIKIDTTPPVTKAILSGTEVDTDWQSEVTVLLKATDNLSGVKANYYYLDGGAKTEFSGPFHISKPGSNGLVYWSVDVADNIEAAKSETIVIESPTSTHLTASPSPSVLGQSVTLTANVFATLSGTPTGTVSFYNGTTLLGTGTLNSSGVATLSTTALPLGSDTLQATYAKATYYLASTSATFAQTVSNPPTATATAPAIVFNPAAIGVSAGSAQTLTASFSVSNYTGSFTPTATLHYGHDYKLGAVNCAGGNGAETCSVPVTFLPTLPGARKDAVQLMADSTILATELVGGTGQGPMALMQPGVVTSPIAAAPYYIYQAAVDENGTVYFVVDNGNAVYSLAKGSSTPSLLPITGLSSPHGIDIDGSGTLYIAQNNYGTNIITYNTVTGVQGTIAVVPPPPYNPCSTDETLYSVAVDVAGNLFTLEIDCGQIFELKANGTYTATAIDPVMTGPNDITVDAADNVFVGGYDINELTPGGVQTQINTVGASEGIQADAAGTLYATRYTGGGVAELPATDYSTSTFTLDPTASPLGEGLGSDGTLYVGNYSDLDKVDRSQGLIAFGEQFAGTASTTQYASLYNGGNQSLTVSSIAISGAPFTLLPGATNNCTIGLVIAPGSLCDVGVTITPPHAGLYSGTVTFTSNSLNTTSTVQTVALSAYVYGVYMVPSPTTLNFANETAGTTSSASMVMLTNEGDLYSAGIGTPSSSDPAFNPTLGTCTVSIAVGSSCQLNVTFSPSKAQPYSATITVPLSSEGGGTTPSAVFTVNGMGVTSATVTPPASSL